MAAQDPPIAVLTKFRAPTAASIDDLGDGSQHSQQWIKILRPFYHAPGYLRSTWGRGEEQPEVITLVSAWESKAAFTNLKAAPEYKTEFLSGISSLGGSFISEEEVASRDFGKIFITHSLKGKRVTFTRVYFPIAIAAEKREAIDEINGLAHNHFVLAQSLAHLNPYTRQPTKFWISGQSEYQGREAQVLLYLHFWKSAEDERRFKEKMTTMQTRSNGDGTATVIGNVLDVELFENALKDAGAVGWTDDTCLFQALPYTLPSLQ